jgi:hypothetical protein
MFNKFKILCVKRLHGGLLNLPNLQPFMIKKGYTTKVSTLTPVSVTLLIGKIALFAHLRCSVKSESAISSALKPVEYSEIKKNITAPETLVFFTAGIVYFNITYHRFQANVIRKSDIITQTETISQRGKGKFKLFSDRDHIGIIFLPAVGWSPGKLHLCK